MSANSSPYRSGFFITKDHLGQDDDHTYGWPFFLGEKRPYGSDWYPIELYDDDKNLYFEGYALDSDSVHGFEAAWEWGSWYAGCTILKSEGEYIIA